MSHYSMKELLNVSLLINVAMKGNQEGFGGTAKSEQKIFATTPFRLTLIYSFVKVFYYL